MATRFPARASEAHCIPKQTNNHNNIVGVTTECVKVVRGDPRNVVGDGYKIAAMTAVIAVMTSKKWNYHEIITFCIL